MKIDLDELERKARAATPGIWYQYESLVCGPNGANMDIADCALGSEPDDAEEWSAALADAAHIAANNPPVTLALVARIRELEDLGRDYARDLDTDEFPRAAAAVREILERGAVVE